MPIADANAVSGPLGSAPAGNTGWNGESGAAAKVAHARMPAAEAPTGSHDGPTEASWLPVDVPGCVMSSGGEMSPEGPAPGGGMSLGGRAPGGASPERCTAPTVPSPPYRLGCSNLPKIAMSPSRIAPGSPTQRSRSNHHTGVLSICRPSPSGHTIRIASR